MAQIVKNLSAMQETHVWSLGLEDPLDKGKATNCSILAWGISVSFMISWTVAHQAPLSMGFPRQEYWSELSTSSPGESSWVRDWTQVSCIGRQILYHLSHQGNPKAANKTTLKKQPEQETTLGPQVFLPLFSKTLEASPAASTKLKTVFSFNTLACCSRLS